MYQPDTKKYPWLVSKYDAWDEDGNPEVEEYELFDQLPEGWLVAFGDLMCEDLDEAIKRGHLNNFQMDEVKEKWGRATIYSSGGNAETDEIIEDYSKLSENICIKCGKPDVHMTNSGWYFPCCEDCWEKFNSSPYQKCLADDGEGRMAEKRWVRKTIKNKTQDIEFDLRDKAERIRKAWKERQNE